MRRREFISLLGGPAAAWPLMARAQEAEGMRRIGVLMGYAENDPEAQTRLAAFKQELLALMGRAPQPADRPSMGLGRLRSARLRIVGRK